MFESAFECGGAPHPLAGRAHCAVYFDRVDFRQLWCSEYYTNGK